MQIKKLYVYLLVIALALLICFQVYSFLTLYSKVNRSKDSINSNFAVLQQKILLTQEAVFADKIESIVKGCQTDQEKTIAVAEWIATNIASRETVPGTFNSFATRTGLCGNRANIFVKAMRLLYIPAVNFNMYNFGRVGGGHSCVQAYYNGKWHFFDVTYAGYFMKNNDVLSWEEVVADPEDALKHLVVIGGSLDRSHEKSPRIDNQKRMASVYTLAAIAGSARSSGPLCESVKYLDVNIDASTFPLIVGEKDANTSDVWHLGRELKLTENLNNTLNTRVDLFHVKWEFEHLTPGHNYQISYNLLQPYRERTIDCWAKAEKGADIFIGQTYTGKPKPDDWIIKFKATATEAVIICGYDTRELGRGAHIDAISISEEP